MSLILCAFPADRAGLPLQVVLATTEAEHLEVQRLRHRIYVQELGKIPADHPYVHGDRLADPYDAWSSQLLLRHGDEPIGTIRATEALNGPLELAEYVDVGTYLPPGARPAELTRFMVVKAHRRTRAAWLLGYGALRLLTSSRSTHIVGAAKLGSLGRHYANAGMRLLGAPDFEYELVGGRYRLGAYPIGEPGSLRRTAIRLGYGAVKALAGRLEPVVHLHTRRRLQPA